MNSGATAERVYEALRRRIMAREFRPGDRLDPAALAETLASSVTPVRDALHMLAGERLVETRTSDGFHLPSIDEPGLKDLYGWTNDVVGLAIRVWRPAPLPPLGGSPEADIAERSAKLFAAIASGSDNLEHRHAVFALNARLHAVRTVEPRVIGGVDAELEAIGAGLAEGDRQSLRRLVASYHRRRLRAAAEIVRAVYRAE